MGLSGFELSKLWYIFVLFRCYPSNWSSIFSKCSFLVNCYQTTEIQELVLDAQMKESILMNAKLFEQSNQENSKTNSKIWVLKVLVNGYIGFYPACWTSFL